MALMDLAPTLLDLLGYEAPPSMQGRSLAQHLQTGQPVDPVPIMHEAQAAYALAYDRLVFDWIRPSFAVTLWPLRLTRIRTSDGFRYTLYDLAADPGETKNLYEARAGEVGHLQSLVDSYEPTALAAQQDLERPLGTRSARKEPTVEIDPARYEKLRALGYVR
jgi:arylsulfatase A-like enzyme